MAALCEGQMFDTVPQRAGRHPECKLAASLPAALSTWDDFWNTKL